MLIRRIYIFLLAVCFFFLICNCGGGGGNSVAPVIASPTATPTTPPSASGYCGNWGHTGSNPWTVSSNSNGTASVALADVAACIRNATSGDTINVPAGRATWTGSLIIPEGKTINLIGAGSSSDGTTIIMSGSGNISALSPNYQISHFRFLAEYGNTKPIIDAKNIGWRIHHNYFGHVTPGYTTRGNTEFIIPTGANDGVLGRHPEGLIDSNIFSDGRIVVYGESSTELAAQNALWAEDSAIGTGNAVYVENNIFSDRLTGNVIDSNNGGKYVFRYNSVSEGNYSDEAPIYVMAHSLQGKAERGAKSWEVYNNSFTYNNDKSYALAFMRGGTGMFYNNVLTASSSRTYIITVDNVRSIGCTACGNNPPPATTDSGNCIGTSLWDGNIIRTGNGAGWPCRDQIGRGKDTGTDSSVIGRATSSEPAYFWNNTRNTGDNIAVSIVSAAQYHIVANRDYYEAVTYGELMQKPTSYTAYTCPHPLAGLTGSCDSSLAGTAGYNK